MANASPLILLPWNDPWELTQTRPSTFEYCSKGGNKIFKEYLADLRLQREATVVGKAGVTTELVDGLKRYLANLHAVETKDGEWEKFRPEWTSPLSKRPQHFFRLQGLKQEQAMGTFLLASMLRQLGLQRAQEMATSSGALAGGDMAESEARAAKAAAAVALLREAAGVYGYLANTLLLAAGPTFGGGERPVEMTPAVALCMQSVCLGEGQAVTAFRALDRGSGASTVAKLHSGAASCWEAAGRHASDASGEGQLLSDRLTRLLTSAAALHRSRAHVLAALEAAAVDDVANAERSVMEALSQLKDASRQSGDVQAWKTLPASMSEEAERLRVKYSRERTTVHFTPLPSSAAALPTGVVMVTAQPYAPNTAALEWDEKEKAGACQVS